MTAAKEAGMICITTPSEFAQGHDFSKADLILKDLETPTPLMAKDLDKLFES